MVNGLLTQLLIALERGEEEQRESALGTIERRKNEARNMFIGWAQRRPRYLMPKIFNFDNLLPFVDAVSSQRSIGSGKTVSTRREPERLILSPLMSDRNEGDD